MFYLTTHSIHFIYHYMASDIWLRTILIVKKETCCRHIGYSFWLTARVLLYTPSHRQDSLCYTSRGALAGTRNSSMGPPYEGSIRRPIAPWAGALTTELHLVPWNTLEENTQHIKFNKQLNVCVCVSVCTCVCVCICVHTHTHIYIYIYKKRKKKENQMLHKKCDIPALH